MLRSAAMRLASSPSLHVIFSGAVTAAVPIVVIAATLSTPPVLYCQSPGVSFDQESLHDLAGCDVGAPPVEVSGVIEGEEIVLR